MKWIIVRWWDVLLTLTHQYSIIICHMPNCILTYSIEKYNDRNQCW
jgi:hypothetical protein